MTCSECTRMGRPCVTSSVNRLDAAVDKLSEKIRSDEERLAASMDEMGELLSLIFAVIVRMRSTTAETNCPMVIQLGRFILQFKLNKPLVLFYESSRMVVLSMHTEFLSDPYAKSVYRSHYVCKKRK